MLSFLLCLLSAAVGAALGLVAGRRSALGLERVNARVWAMAELRAALVVREVRAARVAERAQRQIAMSDRALLGAMLGI